MSNEIVKTPALAANQDCITLNGNTYICQFPGRRMQLQIQDRTQVNGNTSYERLADELLKHVVVEPKLTVESFDIGTGRENDFDKLIEFAGAVWQGKFPNKRKSD